MLLAENYDDVFEAVYWNRPIVLILFYRIRCVFFLKNILRTLCF